MISRHWLLGLAVAAAAAFLVPAPAAHADTANCLFSTVMNLDPAIKRAPLLGGDSTFYLTGGADCHYVDATGPGAGTAYETKGRVASNGLYRNDVCTTGTLVADWDNPPRPGFTTIDFAHANATDVASMRYVGRLTAGVGAVAMKDVNGDPDQAGGGWLVTLPRTGSCVAPTGVSSLDVLMHFAIAL